jgi:hypothetical protein
LDWRGKSGKIPRSEKAVCIVKKRDSLRICKTCFKFKEVFFTKIVLFEPIVNVTSCDDSEAK